MPEREILFIVYNAEAGGAVNTITRRQAEHLATDGYNVTLLTNSRNPNWNKVDYCHVPEFDSRFWKVADYLAVRITNRLSVWLKKQFDFYRVIPQIRFPKSVYSAIRDNPHLRTASLCVTPQHASVFGLVQLKRTIRIPFILIAHGDIFEHPKNSFSRPMRFLYKKAAILAYKNADQVVAVSNSIARVALDCGAIVSSVSVVHNGVEQPEMELKEKAARIHGSALKLIFVGRLAPEKGVSYLLEAMTRFNAEEVSLTIIGHGPLFYMLKEQAHELNISSQVDFIGHISHDKLGAYYANADILVLPSLSEAFGLVILEAQSYGVPVIATRVGGIPDLVIDGRNGFLVEPRDSSDLAVAIEKFLNNSVNLCEMRREGIKNSNSFTWGASLNKLSGIIDHQLRLHVL